MAKRPAFFIRQEKVVQDNFSFEWFPGFSISQKQKSIESLHSAILEIDADARPLEISTKSKEMIGINLSAFNLRLDNDTLENIFQSAKVFANGGPYLDLLHVPPKDAKRDERLHNSGNLIAFRYQNEDFPLIPKTVFYDFIYFSAVKNSFAADEIKEILSYNYFTDIEFNPTKSIKSISFILTDEKFAKENSLFYFSTFNFKNAPICCFNGESIHYIICFNFNNL